MQWHMPIGYKVINGTITVYEEHRELVEQIFRAYDSGESARQIAQKLKDAGVTNAQDRVGWSCSGIGRILENRHYLGTECYPQIIDSELFERVQKRREQYRIERGRGQYRPDKNARILFGGVLVCAECGGAYTHRQVRNGTKSGKPARWKCKNYEYHNKKGIGAGTLTDEQVKSICISAINQIIKNRTLILQKEQEVSGPSPKYRELERRLERTKEENGQGTSDEDIMKLLYGRAAERYRSLKVRDTAFRSSQIDQRLAGMDILMEFDEELYRKLIERIEVYTDSSVKVIFHNGSSVKVENAGGEPPGKEDPCQK